MVKARDKWSKSHSSLLTTIVEQDIAMHQMQYSMLDKAPLAPFELAS